MPDSETDKAMPINWGAILKEAIPAVAQVAGNAAAGRGTGRVQQAGIQQAQDQNALNTYIAQQAAQERALEAIDQGRLSRAAGQMAEQQAALTAPGQRAGNAVRGDILANARDVTVSHPRANVVNFGGGLRPSLMSENTRALGRDMSREALMSQLGGAKTPYSSLADPAASFSSVLGRQAPKQTPLPQENAMDRILNAIGTYGSLAGAAIPGARQPAAPPPSPDQMSQRPLGQGQIDYAQLTPEQLAILRPPKQRGV